jgi:hypothetical protein
MDHSQAVQQMAAERYLLDELTPEERDAFEAHFFDCPDCALDLRAGVAFVDEARIQLPALAAHSPAPHGADTRKPKVNTNRRFGWWRPAFAAAAFASLLAVVSYQNLVTYPALRGAADQPRILPLVPMHGDMRGGHLTITTDRKHGISLPLDLSGSTNAASYASYSLDLLDPDGKLQWTSSVPASGEYESTVQLYSLAIPGATLRNGLYTIVVSGVEPHGERTMIDRYVIEIHLTD